MEKKYEMIPEGNMFRVKALRSFGNVKKGEVGGLIESGCNLSHYGNSWVYDDAMVFGCAEVYEDARIYGNAAVYDSKVHDKAQVFGDARVGGEAEISGNAEVSGKSDYIVFKNWWSSGRYFTWTRSNDMWRVGCFFGSGEELIKKAYEDSEEKGKQYEKIVKYVESIKAD